MSMSRRGFLGAMLGAMAAPAIVKSENLMKIFVPPEKKIITRLQQLAGDFDGDATSWSPEYAEWKNSGPHVYVDHFSETFWPTVVLAPGMVGLQPSQKYELNKAGILVRRLQ